MLSIYARHEDTFPWNCESHGAGSISSNPGLVRIAHYLG